MRCVRIWFKKMGMSRYVSHLDLMRAMTRAMRRANVPLWYTEGYNPHPYMTFSLPLSLGMESLCESMDIRIEGESTNEDIFNLLKGSMPPGIEIISVDEPVFDSNRDGRIDDADKIDFDGDGKVGNTSIKYSDYKDLSVGQRNKGAIHPSCERNLNPVKPPAYFKVINNDGVDGKGGYVFEVMDTSGQGISDGLWYNTVDSMGGFFGGTKFIYGEGEGDFFIGTANKNNITKTFKFK